MACCTSTRATEWVGGCHGGFLPRKAVGAGWNIFSTILP